MPPSQRLWYRNGRPLCRSWWTLNKGTQIHIEFGVNSTIQVQVLQDVNTNESEEAKVTVQILFIIHDL